MVMFRTVQAQQEIFAHSTPASIKYFYLQVESMQIDLILFLAKRDSGSGLNFSLPDHPLLLTASIPNPARLLSFQERMHLI